MKFTICDLTQIQIQDSSDLPGPIASTGVIVDPINADTTVLTRIRGAFVDIRFAILSGPSGLAFASVFVVGQRQANAVVPARILLAESYSQLRFAEIAGKAGLAAAAEVATRVFAAGAAIATWSVLTW